MAIVLMVLKIIGIVLLALIGLLLFIILLVLFVPIRYEVRASKEENADIEAYVKVTWLIHLLNILAWYKGELFYRVRITIIPVFKSDNLKRKRKTDTNNKSSTKTEIKDTSSSVKDEAVSGNIEKKENTEISINSDFNASREAENVQIIESIDDFSIYRGEEEVYSGDSTENDIIEEEEEASFSDKIFEFSSFLIDLIFNINEKLDSILIKIKDSLDNINYYVDMINDDRNRKLISECVERLLGVLKHIAPKKIKGLLHIGLEDAYDMGKMFTIYGVLFPLIHDKIQLVPDYDKKLIEGNIMIKGRVQLVILLWTAYKIYFNKDFRRLRKTLKKND